jgi:hypothetical protein
MDDEYDHMHLDVVTISAARQQIDARIAEACIQAGQAARIPELILSSLTLEQVQAGLLRQPAAARAPAAVGDLEAIARTAFARMTAPAPAAQRRPAPANDRAAFSSVAWPAGRSA